MSTPSTGEIRPNSAYIDRAESIVRQRFPLAAHDEVVISLPLFKITNLLAEAMASLCDPSPETILAALKSGRPIRLSALRAAAAIRNPAKPSAPAAEFPTLPEHLQFKDVLGVREVGYLAEPDAGLAVRRNITLTVLTRTGAQLAEILLSPPPAPPGDSPGDGDDTYLTLVQTVSECVQDCDALLKLAQAAEARLLLIAGHYIDAEGLDADVAGEVCHG